jgi:hypothetical protein
MLAKHKLGIRRLAHYGPAAHKLIQCRLTSTLLVLDKVVRYKLISCGLTENELTFR